MQAFLDPVQLSSRTSFESEFEFQDATGSKIGCIWHYSTEAVQLISCFRIYISEHIKQPEESNYTCFSKFVPESIHQRKCIKKSKKSLQMHAICSSVCSFCPHCTINIRWLSTSSLESCAKSLKTLQMMKQLPWAEGVSNLYMRSSQCPFDRRG